MKKDRDCGMQYSMYSQMPMMPIPNQMPFQQMPSQMPYQQMPNQTMNQDWMNQITNLEKRVTTLENLVNSNNSYNNANYQMM